MHHTNIGAHLLSHEPRATHAPLGDRAALVLEVVDILLAVAVVGGREDALRVRGRVGLLARRMPAAPQRMPVVGLLRVDPVVPVARGTGAQLCTTHRDATCTEENRQHGGEGFSMGNRLGNGP